MSVPRPASTSQLATPRPSQSAPLTKQTDTQPIQPWIQFFIALWARTGGSVGIDAAALSSDVATLDVLTTIADAPDPTPIPPLPVPITPGASPFSYQAPWSGSVLINGGTVSAVAIARDGATFFSCPTAGFVPVFQGDVVKVTYTGAPTMTMIVG